MESEMIILMKRDTKLVRYLHLRKALVFIGSVGILSFCFCIFSEWKMTEAIKGISLTTFLERPAKLPYYWIWLQLGGIMVLNNFVRSDVLGHGSSLVIKVSDRSHIWISKTVTAIWFMCVMYGCCYGVTKGICLFLKINIDVIEMGYVYALMGAICSYMIYSVLSLIMPSIASLIVVFIYLCMGLPNSISVLPINAFMLERLSRYNEEASGTINFTLIVFLCTVIIALFAGSILIRNVDILSEREKVYE